MKARPLNWGKKRRRKEFSHGLLGNKVCCAELSLPQLRVCRDRARVDKVLSLIRRGVRLGYVEEAMKR